MKRLSPSVVAMFLCGLVLCALLAAGCGDSVTPAGGAGAALRIKSGVTVPADCQQWLLSFIAAFNANDGIKILELSTPKEVAAEMAKAPDQARKAMADSASQNLQRITGAIGTIKRLSVESCRESVPGNNAPPDPLGAGRYVEMQGAISGSKHDARASFRLSRQDAGSGPIIGLWNFTWSPL